MTSGTKGIVRLFNRLAERIIDLPATVSTSSITHYNLKQTKRSHDEICA